MFPRIFALLAFTFALLIASATTTSAQLPNNSPAGMAAGAAVNLPAVQVNHVFIVMEENHSYTDVIGNPAMPYLNSLGLRLLGGPGILCKHPSLHRQLLHAYDWANHHQ